MKFQLLPILILIYITMMGCTSSDPKTNLPNVIIFFTDDQGYGDVGIYGAQDYETPNFDRLATSGLKFTDFYVAATVCTPSRAALLTGKYPIKTHLHEAVLFPYSDHGLDSSEFSLGKMFRAKGYSTACIGKWHLGHQDQYMPLNHGFDYFYGVPYSNDMNRYFYKHNQFQAPPLPFYENRTLIDEDPDQRYLTRRYTEKTIERIKARGNQPFFIYLAHNMPHLPLYVSEKFEGKSKLGLYGDVIMELDWSMGEIMKTLEAEGIADNTIIIFSSDNGPVLRVDGSAGPLRGQKAQTWEGGQRVPCIIRWPQTIPANSTTGTMATSMDLMPTLAQIIGYDKEFETDGRNILPLLENPSLTFEDFPFFYYARNGEIEAVRKGPWKLHVKKSIGWSLEKEGNFQPALYHLDKEIAEQQNLIEAHPEKVAELQNDLDQWEKSLIP